MHDAGIYQVPGYRKGARSNPDRQLAARLPRDTLVAKARTNLICFLRAEKFRFVGLQVVLYVPGSRPNEAILIECWDFDPSVTRFTPHTAFEDPATPRGTPARQSIEFRTIAFFD